MEVVVSDCKNPYKITKYINPQLIVICNYEVLDKNINNYVED